MLCHDEGFVDFQIRYVGGLCVMFEFTSKEACTNLLVSDAVSHWIIEKPQWDRNFVSQDRIIWFDIEGLPLRAWSKLPFREILAKWGCVVQLDDNLGEDIYKSHECILTSHLGIIFEVVKVSVDGIIFPVRAKEAPSWTSSFSCDFMKSVGGEDEGHV
ncbi:unnamed protein product [Lactuca saligna]|uniref:DUF4283 domain-containing protein n=1 Tax=Lactuca saligna TaxID=75948 RepID=A0AA35YQY6_LACSI|nr:unnamed protein product [Lactuca saligna]